MSSSSTHALTTPEVDPRDSSRFSDDSEVDEASPPAKSPGSVISGVYRGFRRLAPGRDDVARSRRHSPLSPAAPTTTPTAPTFTSTTPTSTPPLPSSRFRLSRTRQHGRSLSLQDSLAKPLPEPPQPQLSPQTPSTPLASLQGNLDTIADTESDMDSRTSTMDSSSSAGPSMYGGGGGGAPEGYDGGQSSLSAGGSRQEGGGGDIKDSLTPRSNGPLSAGPSPSVSQQPRTPGTAGSQPASATHLSGLMCNVHRTTGREPHPLVGATTTILGDKLYVFGGRILSRSRPAPLTSDLYELDLIRRHWTKLETGGDVPPPRYFHSMCALGDSKMVCYGGMSPAPNQSSSPSNDQQPEVTVMSDIYVYDVATRRWTYIPTQDSPQGRYAHCACILPSSAVFSSHRAPLSALQHNPSSGNPNEGRIGINIDGAGGAEMIVVGGQDGANHYIEQISVFNLRSLKWTSTQPLGKSCGAYRSVVAPLPPSVTAKLGRASSANGPQRDGGFSHEAREPGSSMLIYSNYNFLDVKLELQIRAPDGSLAEKQMVSAYSPPGLRFPNGGVLDTRFVVSGTYLTSSKQEYALWALDLRNLTWSRIDAGGSVFSQGSWNRGVLWNRRNTFVILGNRKRSLVDDYNHRRINFSNVCMVELEAFGFYDNPRKTSPMSGFVSASSPYAGPGLNVTRKAGYTAGGRYHSRASEELGEKALAMRELCDMDILCFAGERVPINSRIVARRWGPYFVQLLREGTATQEGSDSATLRSAMSGMSAMSAMSGMGNMRSSSAMTVTPSDRNTMGSSMSMSSTLFSSGASAAGKAPSTGVSSLGSPGGALDAATMATINTAPTPRTLPPNSRPRCLYLPHTYLTVMALLHFLYTSSLPAQSSPLCTPQILCSLLQIARPYRIDGLLEAVVERLHALLDSRNAAAVFNATAMAAGGGRGIDGTLNPNFYVPSTEPANLAPRSGASDVSSQAAPPLSATASNGGGGGGGGGASSSSTAASDAQSLASRTAALRINTTVAGPSGGRPASDELSATTSMSGSEWSSELGDSERGGGGGGGTSSGPREVWSGELSSVIGLQKRGLRGLMEGRRMRERTGTNTSAGPGPTGPYGGPQGPGQGQQQQPQQAQSRVGLGIAGP